MVLTHMLMTSKILEYLDLSNNHIDGKAVFCLAQGLKVSRSICYVNLEGNPLGQSASRAVLNAKTTNQQEFTIELRNTGSDSEPSTFKTFQIENPEGPYELDLTQIYDQLVMNDLLSLSKSLAQDFEQK